jgi:hypothetical protein
MRLSYRLIDSTFGPSWDPMAEGELHYTLVIRGPRGTDTLRHVIVPGMLAADDTTVSGIRMRGEYDRQLFVFSAVTRSTRLYDVPDDVWSEFTDLAISPGGRFLAYVVSDSDSDRGAVRELATGRLVLRSPPAQDCYCDVDWHDARWLTADSFEIAVKGIQGRPDWLLFAGNATARRSHVDTLTQEPAWH